VSVRADVGRRIDLEVAVAPWHNDASAEAAMQELGAQYPRYGYRRFQLFLGRCGYG
jgi:hypothetical protein